MTDIIYYGVVYLGWLPLLIITGVLYVKWNDKRLFVTPLIAGILQSGGWALHVYDHNRLAGTPDQMYSWIVPLFISIVGWIVIIFGVIRLVLKHKDMKKEAKP